MSRNRNQETRIKIKMSADCGVQKDTENYKSQIPNFKQITKHNDQNHKRKKYYFGI
jgi:hypothetical protein